MEKTFREVFFNPPQNALTFKTKLFCVSTKTPLRLTPNSLTFECKLKGVFSKIKSALRCTENSCQFENLFLTKLTG